jgi:site-specific DNA-methyltransferase (adenine-specific)
MTPYYADDLVTIYHGDCRALGLSIETPAALVSDPPYGMRWDNSVSIGPNGKGATGTRASRYGERIVGDDEPFDPAAWLDFAEVILWGSNHYAQRLPVGTTLVWLKRYDDALGSYLSDAEVAWEKGGHGVYCFRETGYKGNEERYHPTQKPIALMRWCIGRTTSPLVIDPFAGSGTTLRAAKDLGRRAIGIEIEERYCEIAARRCSQEVLGLVG